MVKLSIWEVKYEKIVFVFLLIISMGAMHYFSTQDGGTSTSQTAVAIKIIDKVREKVTLQDEKLINIKDKVINKLKQYNGNMTDVFIDSCGALCAIIILSILFGTGKGIKNILKIKAY